MDTFHDVSFIMVLLELGTFLKHKSVDAPSSSVAALAASQDKFEGDAFIREHLSPSLGPLRGVG